MCQVQLYHRRVGPADEQGACFSNCADDIVEQVVVVGDHGFRHVCSLSSRCWRRSLHEGAHRTIRRPPRWSIRPSPSPSCSEHNSHRPIARSSAAVANPRRAGGRSSAAPELAARAGSGNCDRAAFSATSVTTSPVSFTTVVVSGQVTSADGATGSPSGPRFTNVESWGSFHYRTASR